MFVSLSQVLSTCAHALVLYDVPVRKAESLYIDFILCVVITHDTRYISHR